MVKYSIKGGMKMRKAKKVTLVLFFIFVFCFTAIAQTQYTADDYEKAKDCLNTYLQGVLLLDFDTVLSCKLPGYEQKCKLLITNEDVNNIQYVHDSHAIAIYEKYGEVHAGYKGPNIEYFITAAEPYIAREKALEIGYLNGIRIKVLLNSTQYVAYLAKDNNNLWKMYQIAPGDDFDGSNAYFYSQPQNNVNTNTSTPAQQNPSSPYQHLPEALVGGLLGFFVANIRRNHAYFDFVNIFDAGMEQLSKTTRWKYAKFLLKPVVFVATGLVNLYDAKNYCLERHLSTQIARYAWLIVETALPICLPGIILGALSFIGTSIIASIAAVIVSAILSFVIAYTLDKITPIFFRSP